MNGTFTGSGRVWVQRLGQVRNHVRQELIGQQLDEHLTCPGSVLDVGAGQGTQALRLARKGHTVVAVEPDVAMRTQFTTTLAAETREVRDRVQLVDASVEQLPTSLATFDAVLALGVLMYVEDPFGALSELAARVAPGGYLALAVRTTTSAVWRPAARQDWAAARAAIHEHEAATREHRPAKYINEIGAPSLAVDLDMVLERCRSHGLQLERWYGIRIAVDSQEHDPWPPRDEQVLQDLLEVESYLSRHDTFRHLGQLAHVILRRPN